MDTTPLWQRALARLSVAVVAVVAAVVSWEHMSHVAHAAGEPFYALVPLSVDGMVVSSSLAAFAAKRHGTKVPKMTVFSLTVGLAVSVAANVYAPFLPQGVVTTNHYVMAAVGAWPAIALALSFESLLRLRLPAAKAQQAAPVTEERQVIQEAERITAESAAAPEPVATEHQIRVREAATHVAEVSAELDERLAKVDRAVPVDDGDPYSKTGAEWTGATAAAAEDKHYDSDQAQLNDRELARQLYLASPDNWTGKSLGERFKRSPSWGRLQIREAKDLPATA